MKKPNIVFFGIDSLRSGRMSCYGYPRLTTPHMDKFAKKGVRFHQCFSPAIPTTPGYASMLTGLDSFSTSVVALGHKGDFAPGITTLPELLRQNGYTSTCIGFKGNIAARGFDTYLEYEGWGAGPDGFARKGEHMNKVAIAELERLSAQEKPFMLFMRHMDPHTPYLPPDPFRRMFYTGNEFDQNNRSLDPLYDFEPFRDYFLSWFPEGCTDNEYIDAQYDGAVAYMDACIQQVLDSVDRLGLEDETLVIITSDHGETLFEHDCYYDHHGLYEPTLTVPLILRFKDRLPQGQVFDDYCQLKDLFPTILDILGIKAEIPFNGRNLMELVRGNEFIQEPEMYLTECTWMRKHGWRTPEWKLIVALEPDLHYKPPVELYNLITDPLELDNLVDREPEVVAYLTDRMNRYVKMREEQTGRPAPITTNFLGWRKEGEAPRPFESSDEAYHTMHIGDTKAAKKLQEKSAEKQ
jgi:arylsulfatase A-like enzyme